jgi:hypothetical protein
MHDLLIKITGYDDEPPVKQDELLSELEGW